MHLFNQKSLREMRSSLILCFPATVAINYALVWLNIFFNEILKIFKVVAKSDVFMTLQV